MATGRPPIFRYCFGRIGMLQETVENGTGALTAIGVAKLIPEPVEAARTR